MGLNSDVRGRRAGRGWRTIGLLIWLAVVIGGLSFHWIRHDSLAARWSAVQDNFSSIIPLGLMAAYGIGRLAWLWWPRRWPQADAATDILVFKRRRSTSIGFLVLIGAFLALMLQSLRQLDSTAMDWIFPLLLGAGWLAVLLGMLRGKRPLVLESDGISGLGRRGAARIPWQRIDKITLQHSPVGSTIDFTLKPETKAPGATTVDKPRKVSVSPEAYGIEPEALLEAIEDFHRRKVIFR